VNKDVYIKLVNLNHQHSHEMSQNYFKPSTRC